eukprot:scaffold222247_cov39-Tisochrysis_lutea.AAC.3
MRKAAFSPVTQRRSITLRAQRAPSLLLAPTKTVQVRPRPIWRPRRSSSSPVTQSPPAATPAELAEPEQPLDIHLPLFSPPTPYRNSRRSPLLIANRREFSDSPPHSPNPSCCLPKSKDGLEKTKTQIDIL